VQGADNRCRQIIAAVRPRGCGADRHALARESAAFPSPIRCPMVGKRVPGLTGSIWLQLLSAPPPETMRAERFPVRATAASDARSARLLWFIERQPTGAPSATTSNEGWAKTIGPSLAGPFTRPFTPASVRAWDNLSSFRFTSSRMSCCAAWVALSASENAAIEGGRNAAEEARGVVRGRAEDVARLVEAGVADRTVDTVVEAVRGRSGTIDTGQVNAVLLQPHWRHNRYQEPAGSFGINVSRTGLPHVRAAARTPDGMGDLKIGWILARFLAESDRLLGKRGKNGFW